MEFLGDGAVGSLHVGGIVEELMGELGTGGGQFVQKFGGKEAGGLRGAEINAGAAEAVQPVQKVTVLGGGELRVELVAIGLQHGT